MTLSSKATFPQISNATDSRKPDMLRLSLGREASMSRRMNTKEQSDWKACWGILWRSLVFMPYMLAIFIGVGSIWLSRWVLPVCAALLIYSSDWLLAALTAALWMVATAHMVDHCLGA